MNAELPDVTISESRGIRYLHLGTPWIQGAMRIAEPQKIELDYVRRMMAWMLFRPEAEVARGRAVQLGLGAGAITRFCAQKLRMRTTVVELNPKVVAACRTWFRLPPESDRLQVVVGDAGRYVSLAKHRASADVLCVDLYDHEAASPVLDSEAFYADTHRLLDEGGVMTVNLFGRDGSFAASHARIVAAYGEGQVLTLKPTPEGNTVVVAMKQVTLPDRGLLARRAENIETRWSLPATKWLRMLRPPPASPASSPAPLPNLPPA